MDGVQKDTIFERTRPPYPDNDYQNEALYDLAAISAVLPPLSPALAADKGRKPKTVNQCSEAQEEGKEGERKRAQPVERPSDPVRERKPKAADYKWFERGKAEPNDSELLLFALIIVICASSAGELKEWASKVIKETAEATAAAAGWRPSKERWPTPARAASLIYEPLSKAFGASWTYGELDAVATAMQSWEGAGQIDGLDVGHIKAYLNKKTGQPLGVPLPADKKTAPPPRWRTWAVVKVARLIVDHGPAFRRLLKLDAEAEPVPSASERIAAAKAEAAAADARAAKAEAALAAMKEERDSVQNKHRMQMERQADAKEKAKEKIKAAIDKHKATAKETAKRRRAETKTKLEAAAKTKAEKAVTDALAKVGKARARARKVEKEAKGSRANLKRAKEAKEKVDGMKDTLDEMKTELEEALRCTKEPRTDEASRRDESGRFKAEPWQQRILKWAQLARRVPPSCIAANISDVLAAFAPEAKWHGVSERQLQLMRSEVTVGGEAIGALRMAMAKRFVSFGFDESTKFGKNVLSTNAQLETQDGEVVDVVPRGATLTAGGTAAEISESIDTKIFAHGRRLLRLWKAAHELLNGEGSWKAAGMPEPEGLGLHRLSEHTLLMSDTCNAARACKRLLAEAAEKAGRKQIGEDVWAAMDEAARAERCKAHIGDCHQHLRNIVLNAAAIGATGYLKAELGDSLDEFSSFDRMSVDGMDLIRAVFKELHVEGEYAKGKQREFDAWRKRYHASEAWMPFERANGSRQDLAFDGAVPIFANRRLVLQFLHGIVSVPTHDNKLEKFLWHVLSCNEMTALLRTSMLMKLLISEPWRWLCGKASKLQDWSAVRSNEVLDAVEQAYVAIAADGRKLLDPTFDPFAAFAASQPAFAEWRKAEAARTVKAPDGTVHRINERILAEARDPKEAGNVQATETTVKLAERMANSALVAMRDPKRAIADKLSSQDGANAASADSSEEMHQAVRGAHVINDYVESTFGCYDAVARQFRRTAVENLSGMAQQMRNGDFDCALTITHDRRKRKEGAAEPEAERDGFFWSGLTDELRESLVEMSRHEAEDARKAGRAALLAHDEAKLQRREERVTAMLNAAVEQYAYATELFNAWQAQGVKTKAEVERYLRDKPEVQQLEFVRKQIEMRVLGLGWDQYATRWSSQSDTRIGTVAHLKALLIDEILPEETAQRRLKSLPTEAAPPQQCMRETKQLGTADADAQALASKALFSPEELKSKVEAAMQRRIEAGISDSVENMNPPEAPPFDQALVGKQLEVLWKYTNMDTGEKQLIWATGRVARVADGLTDKRSSRAQKVLPAGAVLWAWDADPERGEPAGEQWLMLLPKKWNPRTHAQVYSWRFDPREFGAARAAPERPQNVRRNLMDDA